MTPSPRSRLSVLFNESKLLKFQQRRVERHAPGPFSTLQRVEIAEILTGGVDSRLDLSFSTLQRVEIAEIVYPRRSSGRMDRPFSTLQRVEIAEIVKAAIDVTKNAVFQYSSTSRNC